MKEIEHLFADYELSTLLKNKNFTEKCFQYYQHGVLQAYYLEFTDFNTKYKDISIFSAPLWDQVIDWLRQVHNIDVMIRQTKKDGTSYYKVTKIETDDKIIAYSNFCDSPLEAKRKAILQALTLI